MYIERGITQLSSTVHDGRERTWFLCVPLYIEYVYVCINIYSHVFICICIYIYIYIYM